MNYSSLFERFSPLSKVWIYQFESPLNKTMSDLFLRDLTDFTTSWTSHSNKLQADAVIIHNHFVVFAVNDLVQGASGCSIDKSVLFLKNWGMHHHVNFFDRMTIPICVDDNLVFMHLQEIKKRLTVDYSFKQAFYFDNSLSILSQLRTQWIKPLMEAPFLKI